MTARRQFLSHAGMAFVGSALAGCKLGDLNTRPAAASQASLPGRTLHLEPLRASVDRITQITVCTRPFRAQGPRLDVEQIAGKMVVHNYGHGGSGWSLSWGSSAIAVEKALTSGERQVAVMGCGALGLTSALLLQRAGVRVTIYAKDLPPNVRSSLATGVWSPDSRICFEEHATPQFKQQWQTMARRSFSTYQSLLGLPGDPVEFIDTYLVSEPNRAAARGGAPPDTRPKFAELQRELTGDLVPKREDFQPGQHPFGSRSVQGSSTMMFNLSAYSRLLMSDFLANGGRIEIAEFHTPAELSRVQEKTLINATGYGARALFGDRSLTPVRGQLARVIPQPAVHYAIYYDTVSFVPRRDGLVFQATGEDEYYGFGDDGIAPDRAEAELAVNTIAGLFERRGGATGA